MTRRLRVVIAVSATCLFALVNWNLFLNSWLESRSVDAFDDPGSVYNLTAADIRVIAALGDSISAGLAAKAQVDANRSILFKTFENRGIAFSMGGDENAVTLPNLFARHNPNIRGASHGDHLLELCYGPQCSTPHYLSDYLNAAQSGSMIVNIKEQIQYLIERMLITPGIRIRKDYKLITLLIGSNDLCASCTNLIGHTVLSPEAFETFLRFNMEVIRRALPRTIVNVVQLLNISQVYELTRNVPHCAKLRKSGLIFECTCAFLEGANGNDARAKMDLMAHEYNKRIEKVALYYQDLNDTSFTVRVDPLLSKVKLSEWPLDYLSSLDCFHPSLIAHEKLAVGVWNNLFLPFNQRNSNIFPNQTDIPFTPNATSKIIIT